MSAVPTVVPAYGPKTELPGETVFSFDFGVRVDNHRVVWRMKNGSCGTTMFHLGRARGHKPQGLRSDEDVQVDSSRRAVVVVKQTAETFTPPDCPVVRPDPFGGDDQPVLQSLVISLVMVQLSNTTPILLTSVKSAIRGIHGTAGQYGCMPVS
jgi:hypothetical protein